MNLRLFLLLALLCVPRVLAQALPELGDVSGAAISPADERKLGERIMREIRRDPAYLDDAEVSEYANSLGSRLTARGLPTPNLFTGMHAVHSQREWISLQDMARSVDVLLRLAQLWEERSP